MPHKTILVVDPNPATHRKVGEAFRGSGFDILHSRDIREATAKFNGVQIDLIFSAVSLPGGNGYDLARSLRDRYPAALIYLLSGGFEVYDARRAKESGVDGRIPLPFTPESLRAVVEDAIGPIITSEIPEPPAEVKGIDGPMETATEDLVPLNEAPTAPAPAPVQAPPISEERLATFLPRDYRDAEPVVVDPDVVIPALERAVLEVLPEVVESILRNALGSSAAFRDLVAGAIDESVRNMTPEIARQVIAEHERRRGRR